MERPWKNASAQLIELAVQLAGADKVEARMRCSPAEFSDYRAGRKDLPWPQRDRLIALIVEEQRKLIEKNRRLLDMMRKRP